MVGLVHQPDEGLVVRFQQATDEVIEIRCRPVDLMPLPLVGFSSPLDEPTVGGVLQEGRQVALDPAAVPAWW